MNVALAEQVRASNRIRIFVLILSVQGSAERISVFTVISSVWHRCERLLPVHAHLGKPSNSANIDAKSACSKGTDLSQAFSLTCQPHLWQTASNKIKNGQN